MAAVFDRSLTASEAADLRAQLADDDAALSRYVELVTTHALLGWEHAEADAPPALAKIVPDRHSMGGSNLPGAWRFVSLGFAAAVLLIASAAVVYLFVAGSAEPTLRIDTPMPPTATVMENSHVLSSSETERVVDRAGTFSLTSGTAKLRLSDGTGVKLHDATALTVHGPLAASLTRGSATFECPPSAYGFTVTLPDGRRVVDRGTRFSIELADDGRAVVSVHEGSVDLLPAPVGEAGHNDPPVSLVTAQRADWAGDRIAIRAFAPDPDGDALTLANPSFETVTDAGVIAGWVVEGDRYFLAESIGRSDPKAPQDGARFLTANRDAGSLDTNPTTSVIAQHIDLARFADRVDAGSLAVVVRFAYSAKDGQDRATVSLVFRGVDGKPLAPPLATEPLTNAPPVDTDWAMGELTGPIPAGARSVELSLTADRTAGTRTNVSFDHVRAWVVESQEGAR